MSLGSITELDRRRHVEGFLTKVVVAAEAVSILAPVDTLDGATLAVSAAAAAGAAAGKMLAAEPTCATLAGR